MATMMMTIMNAKRANTKTTIERFAFGPCRNVSTFTLLVSHNGTHNSQSRFGSAFTHDNPRQLGVVRPPGAGDF